LRQIVTRVSRQIDLQLQSDPLAISESRPDGRYVLFAAPLGITFRIDDQTVSVLRVWLFRKRK
jgi:hypothetical protein